MLSLSKHGVGFFNGLLVQHFTNTVTDGRLRRTSHPLTLTLSRRVCRCSRDSPFDKLRVSGIFLEPLMLSLSKHCPRIYRHSPEGEGTF